MNINFLAPVNSLGYGIAGLNVSLALMKAGNNVALFPIGAVEVPEEKKVFIEELKANSSEFDKTAPCLRIWHQDGMAEMVGKGLHVGFPFFELDRFNFRESHHLNSLDRIFVASQWAKCVVADNIGREGDTYVVPLGVDREIFHENITTDRLEQDYTVFINVGKWERRKGHDLLLRAFCRAFTPADKVILKMVSYNPFIGPMNDKWAREYKGSPMGRNIQLEGRLTSQQTLSRVMMSADCGVFPARAEGWNLDLLEMMSLGKTVICTYVTAHTEFVNDTNSRLVYSDQTELAQDGIWFHGQGKWTKLEEHAEEQLILHMRDVHRLKQTGQLTRNDPGIATAIRFSWDNTAREIIKGLS